MISYISKIVFTFLTSLLLNYVKNILLFIFTNILCVEFIVVLNRTAIIYVNWSIIWAWYQKLIECLFYFLLLLSISILISWILIRLINCRFFIEMIFLLRSGLRFDLIDIILTALFGRLNHEEFNLIDLKGMVIILLVQYLEFL